MKIRIFCSFFVFLTFLSSCDILKKMVFVKQPSMLNFVISNSHFRCQEEK